MELLSPNQRCKKMVKAARTATGEKKNSEQDRND